MCKKKKKKTSFIFFFHIKKIKIEKKATKRMAKGQL